MKICIMHLPQLLAYGCEILPCSRLHPALRERSVKRSGRWLHVDSGSFLILTHDISLVTGYESSPLYFGQVIIILG